MGVLWKAIVYLLATCFCPDFTHGQERLDRRTPSSFSDDFTNQDILFFGEPSDEFWRQFFDAYNYRGPLEQDPFFRPLSRPFRQPTFPKFDLQEQFSGPKFQDQYSRPGPNVRYSKPSFDDQFSKPSFEKQFSKPSFEKQYSKPSFEKQYSKPSFEKQYSKPSNSEQYLKPSVDDRYLKPSYGDSKQNYGGLYSKPEYPSPQSDGFQPIRQESEEAQENTYNKYKNYFFRRFGSNFLD